MNGKNCDKDHSVCERILVEELRVVKVSRCTLRDRRRGPKVELNNVYILHRSVLPRCRTRVERVHIEHIFRVTSYLTLPDIECDVDPVNTSGLSDSLSDSVLSEGVNFDWDIHRPCKQSSRSKVTESADTDHDKTGSDRL